MCWIINFLIIIDARYKREDSVFCCIRREILKLIECQHSSVRMYIWYSHCHGCTFVTVTYLHTPRSRVLLEKLASLQLVKKFPAFYGTRRFLTALTSARHLSLSWASPIQSSYLNPTSWRSIQMLSSHLRLGLPSGLFPSGFPTSTLYTPLPYPYGPHAQPISFF